MRSVYVQYPSLIRRRRDDMFVFQKKTVVELANLGPSRISSQALKMSRAFGDRCPRFLRKLCYVQARCFTCLTRTGVDVTGVSYKQWILETRVNIEWRLAYARRATWQTFNVQASVRRSSELVILP